MINIAIIGGGASGLFAAITALSSGAQASVTVFEQLNRVGKKLLATGNGRCNITNENACEIINNKPTHYYGENSEFASYALNKFTTKSLINYLYNNGLILRKENDKYYPYSEQAGTVLDFLRLKCEMLGVNLITDTKVNSIVKSKSDFIINNQHFDKVIVACGGKSSPQLGSDGIGYKLLESFGHKKTKLFPAITQIKTQNDLVKQLKGIKADALCSIFVNKKLIRQEFGQVLFADYGLSGPPIFQLSGIAAKNYEKNCVISLDLMNDKEINEIESLIKKVIDNPFTYPLNAENFLTLLLNKRLGQVVLKYCGKKMNEDIYSFTDKDIKNIAYSIKNFNLKVTGVSGFQNAQVTAGGIKTQDFDDKTMESKLVDGLYACGEVLDITGDCGGYNLQWAFSSGYVAAKSAIGENL